MSDRCSSVKSRFSWPATTTVACGSSGTSVVIAAWSRSRAGATPGRAALSLPFLVLCARRQAQGHTACGRPGHQHRCRNRSLDARLDRGSLGRMARLRLRRSVRHRRIVRRAHLTACSSAGQISPNGSCIRAAPTAASHSRCDATGSSLSRTTARAITCPGFTRVSTATRDSRTTIRLPSQRFAGQGTLAYRPMLSPDGSRLPAFDGLSECWSEGAEYVALYPNLLLGVHKDHTFALRLEPLAPDRRASTWRSGSPTAAALDDAHTDVRERLSALWREVFEEDIQVVEGMQQGRHADRFDGGVLSPRMDAATAAFHQWAATRYAASGLDAG